MGAIDKTNTGAELVKHTEAPSSFSGGLSLGEISDIGKVFAQSGYFKDATDAAKAVTKVLAGQELGIPPMQAMTGIHIVQGKPTLSSALVGALIKRSGRYDYRVVKLDDHECVLGFYERGEHVGESSFTIEQAKTAGLLSNATWKNYPRNMLLSRALTNGARWYCPDVFGGAVYTPDEMGAVIDGETGEILSSPPAARPVPVVEARQASEAQAEEIARLVDELARGEVLDPVKVAEGMQREYGTADPSQLTEEQAANLLDRLRSKRQAVVA